MVNIIGHDLVPRIFVDLGIAGFTPHKTIMFASGIRSPGCYVDCRKLPAHPREWGNALYSAEPFLAHLQPDALAGVEMGGVPHCAVLSHQRQIPSVTVRKQEKDHGVGGLVAGDRSIVEGKRVVVVEDMGTTGDSAFRAVAALRDIGAEVTDVLLLVTYDFPELSARAHELRVNIHALCTFDQILDTAVQWNRIDPRHEKLVRWWLGDPHAEWEWWSEEIT